MFANDKAIVHLKWCNFKSDFTDEFKPLLQTGELSDFQLRLVDGSKICAHKIILRNGSDYFRDVFKVVPRSRYIKLPINAEAGKFAIWFMYHGEVNIPRTDLDAFLKAAKLLRLKGFEAVSICDLSTERDLKIDLSKQSEEYSEHMKKYDGQPLRKKVKSSKKFHIESTTDEFVHRSDSSISTTCTRNWRTKSVHSRYLSSPSNIDFNEFKKSPSSDAQNSPEIVS